MLFCSPEHSIVPIAAESQHLFPAKVISRLARWTTIAHQDYMVGPPETPAYSSPSVMERTKRPVRAAIIIIIMIIIYLIYRALYIQKSQSAKMYYSVLPLIVCLWCSFIMTRRP